MVQTKPHKCNNTTNASENLFQGTNIFLITEFIYEITPSVGPTAMSQSSVVATFCSILTERQLMAKLRYIE